MGKVKIWIYTIEDSVSFFVVCSQKLGKKFKEMWKRRKSREIEAEKGNILLFWINDWVAFTFTVKDMSWFIEISSLIKFTANPLHAFL